MLEGCTYLLEGAIPGWPLHNHCCKGYCQRRDGCCASLGHHVQACFEAPEQGRPVLLGQGVELLLNLRGH